MTKICLRAETKAYEKRSPLSPQAAKVLIDHGIQVFVEESNERCFDIDSFKACGCKIIQEGTWVNLPKDVYILGLKEFPENISTIIHNHIYFGHVFKGQKGWTSLLHKYKQGGGLLIDMEFLISRGGRRVAAFGYWAGYCGAALAVMNWSAQQSIAYGRLPSVAAYKSRDDLFTTLNKQYELALKAVKKKPSAAIIGYKGRCGKGALDLLSELGISPTLWDIEDTAGNEPLIQSLEHNILINCALVTPDTKPFLLSEHLDRQNRILSVICDVSCDPNSPHNPLPIYKKHTTFSKPVQRLREGKNILDLIAIDHLPSLLPAESSQDFSNQLVRTLLQLGQEDCYELNSAISKYHQVLETLE